MSLDCIFEQAAEKFSLGAFIRGMRAEGYDYINHASNTFANCLCKLGDDDVVIVNGDPDCAPAFYKYCMENAGNPLLPKVHEFHSFGQNGCVVRMERLIASDHLEIAEDDKTVLKQNAPMFVSYLLGQSTGFDETSSLRDTAIGILELSQNIYEATKGRILPYCDIKEDNVFLRNTSGGPQFVFGDPLFPGSGGNQENVASMNAIYQKFGLPDLERYSPPLPARSSPAMALSQ